MQFEPRSPRALCAFSALCTLGLVTLASPARADLDAYVKAPDKSFQFAVEKTMDLPGVGQVLTVRLTSQTWQGIPWQHWISIIRPEKVTHPEHALLVVSGGSIKKDPPGALSKEAIFLTGIAQKAGTIVAVLSQVPNQPLFGGLKEDALIAHSFVKYYETKDATWPCLLPMTKSAVRAMDAIQSVVKEKFAEEVSKFVVTGASKRGWTTWLAAAVDPRVVAIAPMVIDTLNMPKQMELQKLSFGKYSEEIQDYTERGLQERLADPASKPLLSLVDPYAYLARLKMPKLIVLGTNDRYWPVDAVKLYFPELLGEKYIHYVPNAGHGLGPGAVEAVSAFYHAVVNNLERPKFTWEIKKSAGASTLEIDCTDTPAKVEFWQTASPTRDFRDARWTGQSIEKNGNGKYSSSLAVPRQGFAAFKGRLTFKSAAGHEYALSTNVEVLGDGSKPTD